MVQQTDAQIKAHDVKAQVRNLVKGVDGVELQVGQERLNDGQRRPHHVILRYKSSTTLKAVEERKVPAELDGVKIERRQIGLWKASKSPAPANSL